MHQRGKGELRPGQDDTAHQLLFAVDCHDGDGGICRDDRQRSGSLLQCGHRTAQQLCAQLGGVVQPQLDAAFTEVVAEKTYEDINGKLAELSSEVKANFEPRYDHSLFENVELNIINVQFDKDYEDAVSEMAKVEMQRKIVEEKAEQLKISTKAQAEAREMQADGEAAYVRKMAEAEAEAMKLKGASENEVREKLGEILKAHPELIKEVLAKNFPKVYGGGNVTPMMDLGDLLGK